MLCPVRLRASLLCLFLYSPLPFVCGPFSRFLQLRIAGFIHVEVGAKSGLADIHDNPAAAGIDLTDVTPFTPEWKWSLGAQYTAYLNDDVSLTPRFDMSYQDEVYSTGSNSDVSRIRAYTLANARVTLRDDANGWEAALQVTNLFDKYYITSIYDSYGRSGVAYGSPGHPREWALTVKQSFCAARPRSQDRADGEGASPGMRLFHIHAVKLTVARRPQLLEK